MKETEMHALSCIHYFIYINIYLQGSMHPYIYREYSIFHVIISVFFFSSLCHVDYAITGDFRLEETSPTDDKLRVGGVMGGVGNVELDADGVAVLLVLGRLSPLLVSRVRHNSLIFALENALTYILYNMTTEKSK